MVDTELTTLTPPYQSISIWIELNYSPATNL